jgi:glucose-1-phosphate thymidylyltransferase
MKAIILAAGYATRLYPLTLNKAKPLLEVARKPIIEHIVKKIEKVKSIDTIYVITNNKFFEQFILWNSNFSSIKNIEIINDQTTSNEDRLGALGDIEYVCNNSDLNDDILLIAGDNLFEFSLKDMNEFFDEKQNTVVALYDVKDIELAKKYGVVEIDSNNKMVEFEEKPEQPKSTLASTGIYLFPKVAIQTLPEFLKAGISDKIGSFLEWLHKKEDIFGYVTEEKWFDIGSLEQLEQAKNSFNS